MRQFGTHYFAHTEFDSANTTSSAIFASLTNHRLALSPITSVPVIDTVSCPSEFRADGMRSKRAIQTVPTTAEAGH